MKFSISPLSSELTEALVHKIDNKTKPVGSLGLLERIALKVGRIQNTLTPEIKHPVMFTVAADHGITDEGVSPCPVDITWQQCLNFLKGGGGVNVFSRHAGMDFFLVDAGVKFTFEPNPKLIDAKVRFGSRNFAKEPALTREECEQALANGAAMVEKVYKNGSNCVAFGEMGIGNTSPASVLLSIFAKLPMDECVGAGSGLDKLGVGHKLHVLKSAVEKHGVPSDPVDVLATYGGLEIATIAGGMLKAAELGMLVMVDGFITTSALLAAHAINPNVTDYCIFGHQSMEPGHKKMIDFLGGEAVLKLDMRLGEGTGATLALHIVEGAIKFLNEMASFEMASVTNTTHIRGIESGVIS